MIASSQNKGDVVSYGLPADFGKNARRSAILRFPALGGCFLLCFTTDVATGSCRRDFSTLMFLVPETGRNACDGTPIT